MFIDPTGETLEVALNVVSYEQLLSIVAQEYQDRVILNSETGVVHVNLEGLDPEALRSLDMGLWLVNSMVTADEHYLFEVKDVTTMANGLLHVTIADPNGVLNASKGGLDANGTYTHVPKEGYDGQVAVLKSGEFLDTKKGTKNVRKSTIFHE